MEVRKERLITEENIRIELCKLLSEWGIEYSTEYKVDNCRFDIVILCHAKIVGIIEVKRDKKQYRRNRKKSKQIEKYEKYGVPVFLLCGEEEIRNGLEFAVNMVDIANRSLKTPATPITPVEM